MKPVRLSRHAQLRALQRGATEGEIAVCVREPTRRPAEGERFSARKTFPFEAVSPMNKLYYRFKTVEVVFAEEADAIVIVTVKVYYSNEEQD